MKKIIALLFAGILVSSVMIGCSKPEEGDNNTATTGTSGKAPETSKGDDAGMTTDKPGETGTTGTTTAPTEGAATPKEGEGTAAPTEGAAAPKEGEAGKPAEGGH